MFYIVNQKPSGKDFERFRTDFFYDDSVKTIDAVRCPKCNSYIGMREPVPPFRVRIETWGTAFGDFVFWLDDFLVSKRFRDAYEASGLRGLREFSPVEVLSCRKHRKHSEEMPLYFRTIPKLGAAKIDLAKSGIDFGEQRELRCDVCLSGPGVLKRWKAVVVDESTWNGDDIFYAYGLPGSLIVSSRFAEWAANFEFKNLVLEDAKCSSHDFYPNEATGTSS
jgi:hypothetical protein